MTAITVTRAKALLKRQTKRNPRATQAVTYLARPGASLSGGVIPLEDALRTYDRRIKWARANGVQIAGDSRLLTRLRQSGLSRIAVFIAATDDHHLVFFADPEYQTLLGSLSLPIDDAGRAETG